MGWLQKEHLILDQLSLDYLMMSALIERFKGAFLMPISFLPGFSV